MTAPSSDAPARAFEDEEASMTSADPSGLAVWIELTSHSLHAPNMLYRMRPFARATSGAGPSLAPSELPFQSLVAGSYMSPVTGVFDPVPPQGSAVPATTCARTSMRVGIPSTPAAFQ